MYLSISIGIVSGLYLHQLISSCIVEPTTTDTCRYTIIYPLQRRGNNCTCVYTASFDGIDEVRDCIGTSIHRTADDIQDSVQNLSDKSKYCRNHITNGRANVSAEATAVRGFEIAVNELSVGYQTITWSSFNETRDY